MAVFDKLVTTLFDTTLLGGERRRLTRYSLGNSQSWSFEGINCHLKGEDGRTSCVDFMLSYWLVFYD